MPAPDTCMPGSIFIFELQPTKLEPFVVSQVASVKVLPPVGGTLPTEAPDESV